VNSSDENAREAQDSIKFCAAPPGYTAGDRKIVFRLSALRHRKEMPETRGVEVVANRTLQQKVFVIVIRWIMCKNRQVSSAPWHS